MELIYTQYSLTTLFKKQKYQLINEHSAVKKCRWLHQSLTQNRYCYKQKFYGIQSHRCIQMTPSLICNMQCKFCWRFHPSEDLKSPLSFQIQKWSEPEEIVEECVKAQRRILSGYGDQVKKGKIDKKKYFEALNPKHVAISLDGEPTLYPKLNELLHEFHKKSFTTFLVTNGTKPEVLKNLSIEPTQLYLSIYAPNEKVFINLCKPATNTLWKKINESLELLSSFKCPTVTRLTLVKGENMEDLNGYAKLINKASPTYVEPKAYMFVGYSRLRLKFENMPTYEEVKMFSEKLAEETSYNIIDESKESRVILLSKLSKPIKFSS
ncbi:MAG: 4-demethylwyosine synthase TYW1 [Candidatus Bathyarchaeia archaeon]|nr:4-demethylwyosine synthase TYW1 [Candidatus Bathyarchaeota archaeon]